MAGEAIVGTLRTVLGLDTGQFEDGAKKAGKAAESFGTSVKAVFEGTLLSRAVERLFDFLAHSFKEGIAHALEFADNMGKMAQKVGVSVEQLTGLKLAADLSDVSMETLSVGLGKLAKNLADAGKGGAESRAQFEALGISVRDTGGNLISPIDALAKISDKFADASDGSAKVAAAMNLLGKSGKELIPLLNQGGAAIANYAKIAQNMGLVVSTDTSKRIEEFNDNMKIVGKTIDGVSNLVVADLAPALQNLSEEWKKQVQGGDLIRATADVISRAIKSIVGFFVQLYYEIKDIPAIFKLLLEAVTLTWDGIVEVFNKGVQPIKDAVTKLVDAIAGPFKTIGVFFTEIGTAIIDKVGGAIAWLINKFPGVSKEAESASVKIQAALSSDKFDEAAIAIDLLSKRIAALGSVSAAEAKKYIEELWTAHHDGAERAKKSLTEVDSKIQDAIDHLKLQTRVLQGSFSNLPPGLPELAASLGLIKKNGDGLVNSLDAMKGKLGKVTAAQQGFLQEQVKQETLTALEQYTQKMDQLNAKFPEGQRNVEAYQRAAEKNALALQDVYATTAQQIVTPMAQAFKTLAEKNKEFAVLAKAAAIAQATVDTYAAATKALGLNALIPGAGFAASAAIVAAGLVNIAKIASTPIAFAKGGSFTVGGVGGIDSQLVQFKATPGEMVDVRKPGQTTTTSEIIVNMRGRDLISKDMLRDLFSALNDGIRDGYRLKLAEA